ncbi:MAG: hypothetical protein A2Y00_10500 [Omnitrophica WOR_2 bacterium GWF2_43_52]|nr:MAG: hypothetical protein A2Y00_10500 [Omnitrophica WOR_2 bacterium GWF2_43_52]OGX53807.1 MAG: hypothetical protein A2460_05970 [Omnitrophica WOR_2 bacterium RIFOXYC2_FULL_43_9]HAH20166.1 hypothetical protein [Candidatus Omnitrophota bacterium]HBG63054.1 hypothetical protein [Candidatus Omnitrophota bacterium]HCD37154.1 hypothetical protein [Candidatus Omnitrophota bacterium]
MARIAIALVLAALTGVCLYSAYITGKTRDMQSAWFFVVFSLFFAIPLLIMIVKALGEKNSVFRKLYNRIAGPKQEQVKFVPHWVMMLVMFIIGSVVIITIVRVILGLTKSF